MQVLARPFAGSWGLALRVKPQLQTDTHEIAFFWRPDVCALDAALAGEIISYGNPWLLTVPSEAIPETLVPRIRIGPVFRNVVQRVDDRSACFAQPGQRTRFWQVRPRLRRTCRPWPERRGDDDPLFLVRFETRAPLDVPMDGASLGAWDAVRQCRAICAMHPVLIRAGGTAIVETDAVVRSRDVRLELHAPLDSVRALPHNMGFRFDLLRRVLRPQPDRYLRVPLVNYGAQTVIIRPGTVIADLSLSGREVRPIDQLTAVA